MPAFGSAEAWTGSPRTHPHRARKGGLVSHGMDQRTRLQPTARIAGSEDRRVAHRVSAHLFAGTGVIRTGRRSSRHTDPVVGATGRAGSGSQRFAALPPRIYLRTRTDDEPVLVVLQLPTGAIPVAGTEGPAWPHCRSAAVSRLERRPAALSLLARSRRVSTVLLSWHSARRQSPGSDERFWTEAKLGRYILC